MSDRDTSFNQSRDGFNVFEPTPFLPSFGSKFDKTDDDFGVSLDLTGYSVDFNQGYIFNSVSSGQVSPDYITIGNMTGHVLPLEHDNHYYVEVKLNAQNFKVNCATLTGVSNNSTGDLTNSFPHVKFDQYDAGVIEFTGYYPILRLQNGDLTEFHQRGDIVLSDRQFKQKGSFVEGTSAHVLVAENRKDDNFPVRVRAILGRSGITVTQNEDYIVLDAEAASGSGGDTGALNIGTAVEVYETDSRNPFEFRTLRGKDGQAGGHGDRNNVTVQLANANGAGGSVDEILISGGICTNIGTAAGDAQVYEEGSIRDFEFRSLKGEGEVTVRQEGEIIIISGSCCDETGTLQSVTDNGRTTTTPTTFGSSTALGSSPVNIVTKETGNGGATVYAHGDTTNPVVEVECDSADHGIIKTNSTDGAKSTEMGSDSSSQGTISTYNGAGTTEFTNIGGTTNGGTVSTNATDGTKSTEITSDSNKRGQVDVYNTAGNTVQSKLGADNNGGVIQTNADDGTKSVDLTSDSNNRGKATVYNADGDETRVVIEVDSNDRGSTSTLDANENLSTKITSDTSNRGVIETYNAAGGSALTSIGGTNLGGIIQVNDTGESKSVTVENDTINRGVVKTFNGDGNIALTSIGGTTLGGIVQVNDTGEAKSVTVENDSSDQGVIKTFNGAGNTALTSIGGTTLGGIIQVNDTGEAKSVTVENDSSDQGVIKTFNAAGSTALTSVGASTNGGEINVNATDDTVSVKITNDGSKRGKLEVYNAAGSTALTTIEADSSDNGKLTQKTSAGAVVNQVSADASTDTYFNSGPVGLGTSEPSAGYAVDVKGTAKVFSSSTPADGLIQLGTATNQTMGVVGGSSNFVYGAGMSSFSSDSDETLDVFTTNSAGYSAIDAYIIGSSPATGSAIMAGSGNSISGHFNVIVAGAKNLISGGTQNFIGGGTGVDIIASTYSVNVGGEDNDIVSGIRTVIGGGFRNKITGAHSANIGGGSENVIEKGNYKSIGGGFQNVISGNSSSSAIAGGLQNKILGDSANYSFIGAGGSNTIKGNSQGSTIAGGVGCIISNSSASFAGGGNSIIISGSDAVALGNYSHVQQGHDGAFVFTDANTTPVLSTGKNTMVMKFESGVFVETTSGLYVNGNPVLTGETPEGDTLDSVTDRGNTTTNNIKVNTLSGSFGMIDVGLAIGPAGSPHTGPRYGLDCEESAFLGGTTIISGNVAGKHTLEISGDAGGTGFGGRLTLGGTGYLLSGDVAGTESDTLQTVTTRGNTTTNDIKAAHISGSDITVYHNSVASRRLSLGWGSVFANDNDNELTLGSNYSSNSATRIFVAAESADNTPADTIQMQANRGLAVFSGVSTDTFDPTALLDVRGNAFISGDIISEKIVSGVSGLFGDRVGIGNVNPQDFNSEGNRLVVGDGSAAQGMTIFAGTSSSASLYFADGTVGSAAYQGWVQYRHGNSRLDFGAAGGRRMSLNGNGLAIGDITSPSAELEISSSAATIRLTDSDLTNHYSEIEKAGVYTYLSSRANAADGGFIFFGGGTDTEFMRIETDGDVGIGSNVPSAKLDVAGGIKLLDNNYLSWNSSNTRIVGNSSYLQFQVAASDKVRIQSDGHVGIGTTTAPSELTVFGTDSDSATASIHCINNNATGALLRLIEGDNHQGGFLQYDGSANKFNIGVHSTNDTTFANDSGAITIDRDTANVGIGTTNPNANLDVGGSMQVKGDSSWAGTDNNNAAIYMNTNARGLHGVFSSSYARNLIQANNNYIELGNQGTSLIYGFKFYAGSTTSSVGTYDFFTSGTNSRLHIEKGGNVGIGTNNPQSALEVINDSSDDGITLKDDGGGLVTRIGSDGSHNARTRFYNGSHALVAEINANAGSPTYFNAGNVGIGLTNPSETLVTSGGNASFHGTAEGYVKALKQRANTSDYDGVSSSILALNNYYATQEYGLYVNNSNNFRIQRSGEAGKFLELNANDFIYSGIRAVFNIANQAPTNLAINLRNENADEVGFYSPATNEIGFVTDRTERMRIDDVGNVGIGSSSPDANLDVTSSANQQHLKIQGAYSEGVGALAIIKTTANGNALSVESATTSSSREIFEVKNSNGAIFDILGNGNVGINDSTPSYALDVNGIIRTQSGLLGTQFGTGPCTTIDGFFASTSTEDYGFQNALLMNDLAGFTKWAGVTIATSGLYKTRGGSAGSYTYSNEAGTGDFDRAFQANNHTVGSWYTDSGPDGDITTGVASTGVIELYFNGVKSLNYSAQAAAIFGSASFRATHVKIEALRTGAWQTILDTTENTKTALIARIASNGGGANATTGLRYSFAKAGSYFRINNLYAADYDLGNDLSYGGQYYIDKYYDGRHYSTLYPVTNGGADLGKSSNKYDVIYGNSGNFTNGITVNGNPVVTGTTAEADTLQTVTDRGATSTNAISVSNSITSNEFIVGNQGKVSSTSANGLQLQATSTDKPIKFLTNVGGQTERMRIGPSGNVGIGTTDPSEKLQVSGNILVTGAGSAGPHLKLAGTYTTWEIENQYAGGANNDMFRIRNTALGSDAFVINRGNNNVGIGTTNPTKTLDINGVTKVNNAELQITSSSSSYTTHFNYEDGGSNYISYANGGATIFRKSSSTVASINSDGVLNVGAAGVTNTRLHVTGAASDSLARFKDGSDGVEITTRGSDRQQIDFLGSNTSAINAKGSLFINYDSDNDGSNDTITFARNGVDEAGTVDMVITEGKVGIGTTTITQGDVEIYKNGADAELCIHEDAGTHEARLHLRRGGSDWDIINNNQLAIETEGTEVFRITTVGNVGIGTSSPSEALDVAGNIFIGTNDIKGATNCKIEMDAADGFTLTNPNNAHGIDIVADDLTFFGGGIGNRKITTNAGDLSIDPVADLLLKENGGNVGIGTDSPQAHLHVSGSGIFGIIGSNTPNSTVTVAGYDDFGLNFRAHGTWTHWKARVGHGKNFELYNDGTVNQKQVLELGKTTKDNASVYIRSTGAFIEAGMNAATSIPVVSMGCLADSDHLGGAYLDVRDAVTRTHRYEFNRDGTFVASGVNVSGDVGGTGDGGRITLNGTGYLLSGEAGTEADTLQTVTDRGNVTTSSVRVEGQLQVGPNDQSSNGELLIRGKEANIILRGLEGSDKAHTIREDGGSLTFSANTTLSGTDGVNRFNIQTGTSFFTERFGVEGNGVEPKFYLASVGGGAHNKATYLYNPSNSADFRIALDGSHSNSTGDIGTDAFTIKSSTHNVGIGTTNPDDKFHIEQDGGSVVMGSPTTSYGGIGFEDTALTTANSALYGVASQTVLGVKAGGAIEMKIANNSSIGLLKMETNKLHYTNGSVGIGLTNPAGDKLMVKGDDNYFASRLDGSTTAGQSMGLRVRAGYNSTDRPVLIEKGDGSDIFIIDGLGNVGIGSAPSYELDVSGTTRSTYYIGGAYLEENASSSKLKFYTDGTVLVMDEDGELKPCEKENDTLVFGVTKKDFDSPVVLGAEPVLVTGPIKVGDYIVTSNKQGHGQSMKEQNIGTIIAQAMESGDGESYNIKAMVRKM